MSIIAKYQGKCNSCGGSISAGEEINWKRGNGTTHIVCPKSEPLPPNTISIGKGEGYGGQPFTVGQILPWKNRDWPTERWLVVLRKKDDYCREDGLSFGVGDDRGYYYSAVCREATAEEAAPLIAAREQKIATREQIKAAQTELKKIVEQIQQPANYPEGSGNYPEGEQIGGKPNIYGGGEWFVLGQDLIWYVQNNGADGDDWAHNNVRTGGAGAIGWCTAFDPVLAARIRELCEILRPGREEKEFQSNLTRHLDEGGREY